MNAAIPDDPRLPATVPSGFPGAGETTPPNQLPIHTRRADRAPGRAGRIPFPPGVERRTATNDLTAREGAWRRWAGDEWACFDALPAAVRRRMQEHAYDPWAVNAHLLWRMFRRRLASSERAERRLLRHLERCEALERVAFDAAHREAFGAPLPHVGAEASVLRASPTGRRGGRAAPGHRPAAGA